MTTTYTYPVDGSEDAVSGLSAANVAEQRLTHDGHDYELRSEDGGWTLYVSQGSRNSARGLGSFSPCYSGPSPYGKRLHSALTDKAAAWTALADLVVFAAWDGVPDAMTDADYSAMVAEYE